MKESPQSIKKPLAHVQTVRLSPEERQHLELLQLTAEKKQGRRVPLNEIMVRGLMRLRRV